MSRPIGHTGKAAVLTTAEIDIVLESTRARTYPTRDKALLTMSFYLGLRAKELASLRTGDVFTAGASVRDVVHIKRAYSKMGRIRDVFLSAQALRDALCQYRVARGAYSAIDPLFVTRSGRAFTPNGLAHLFKDIYAGVGLDRASSHSGRRTMITRLAECGTDLKALAKIAGHASIATTSIYIEDNPVRLAKIMGQLDYS